MHLPEGSEGNQEYQSGKLASQLRFKLGTYQIQAPGSNGSETAIYDVLCGFFSAPLQIPGKNLKLAHDLFLPRPFTIDYSLDVLPFQRHLTKRTQGHCIALKKKKTPFQFCERSTEGSTNTGILPLAQFASPASISDALKILVYTLPKLDYLRRQKTRAEI